MSIDLSNNQLSGLIPESIYNLQSLMSLSLTNNKISGNISPKIGSLNRLKILYLGDNLLDGSLPKEIGNCTQLEQIIIRRNNLSGEIPNEITKLQNLNYLSLSANKLTGNIPKDIGNLSNLRYIALSDNQLTGDVPTSLWKLKKVEELILWGNAFIGSIPSEIGELRNLKNFQLNFKEYNGSLPEEIWNLDSMRTLIIQMPPYDGIKGKIKNPKPIGISNKVQNWKSLTTLYIEGSSDVDTSSSFIQGTIPDKLMRQNSLKNISFGGNSLRGSLNDITGFPDSLTSLILAFNKFNGTIPNRIGNLLLLERLSVDNNSVSGEIPSNFRNLNSLQTLGLRNCNLESGLENIPSHAMRTLYVSGNKFEFDDFIDANINATNYQYSPQDSIGTEKEIEAEEGKSVTIDFEGHDTEGNVYQWYKNDAPLQNATSKDLLISKVSVNDTGAYVCHITNPIAPALTLYTRPVAITAVNPTSVVEDMSQPHYKIYPNPAKDMIEIESLPNSVIIISDLLGNVVLSVSSESSLSHINIEALPVGVYSVIIKSQTHHEIYKFVKI